MTAAQFDAALKRNGMKSRGFLGYVTVYEYPDGGSYNVYPRNYGPRRREQLRQLIRERERAIERWQEDCWQRALLHQLRSGVAS